MNTDHVGSTDLSHEQLVALCDTIAEEVGTQRTELTTLLTDVAKRMQSLDGMSKTVDEIRARVEAGLVPAQVALLQLSAATTAKAKRLERELHPRNFNAAEFSSALADQKRRIA